MLAQIKAGFPVLNNPAKRHKAVGFTPKQFHDLYLPSPAAAIRCTIAGLV